MALSQIFLFTLKVGTGAQHVPFPDPTFSAVGGGVIFYSTDQIGLAAAGAFNLGFDDGTHHFGTGVSMGFAGFPFDDPEHVWSDDSSLVACRTSFAFELKLAAHVTSLNVGSLDLQIDINNGVGGNVWTAVVYGNGALCQAGKVDKNAIAPVVLPFVPGSLMGMYHPGATGGTLPPAAGGNKTPSFGWAVPCGTQAVSVGAAMVGTSNPSNTASAQVSGNWLTTVTPASPGTIADVITIASWDVSGFTPASTTTGEYFSYFAVGGLLASANIGTFTQSAAPGGQPIPILADQPEILWIGSINKLASAGVQVDALVSLGAANVAGQQSAAWFGDLDNKGSEFAHFRQDSSAVVLLATPTGAFASTLTGRAVLSSLASTVINLTWSTTDGIARELVYCVQARDPGTGVCGAPLPPPSPCGPSAPAIPSNPVAPIAPSGSADGSGGVIV
jgi:hypothetical protein